MVLPSISEDDENQSDAESKHTPSPSKSNSLIRSPLHSSPSPRHGKFLQRYLSLWVRSHFYFPFFFFFSPLENTHTYCCVQQRLVFIRLTRIHLNESCFLIKWIKWKEVYCLANETRRIMIANSNTMQKPSLFLVISIDTRLMLE